MGLKKRKIAVLSGEGIECEKESALCFRHKPFEWDVVMAPVPKLLKQPERFLEKFEEGDWIFLPGGFSFSDHFGSGKLLAYQLQKISFFDKLFERGLNVLGNCNGFQVLVAAGLFGPGVSLEANQRGTKKLPFTNRWVHLRGKAEDEAYYLPVRHGEGRLVRQEKNWQPSVKPFLFYHDPVFNNGSVDNVAGLHATIKQSSVWGMMPHPEIARQWGGRPDASGPEFSGKEIDEERKSLFERPGDGVILLTSIIKASMGSSERH